MGELCQVGAHFEALDKSVNFLNFFWYFLYKLIKRNGKMPLEGSKVEKLHKWTTLREVAVIGWVKIRGPI